MSSVVVVVSKAPVFCKRAEKMAANDNHGLLTYETVDDLMNDVVNNLTRIEFMMIDATVVGNDNDVIGLVQIGKQFCAKAYIMVVVGGKTRPEVTVFVKKSGANAVLLESEFLATSKPEYIWTQAVRSPYFAIKSTELKVGTSLDHDLMHFMPMNRKFIKVVPQGTEISASKLQKMQEVGEFYVHKENIDSFLSYSQEHQDNSAAGLTQRCRIQFQKLNNAFSHLVLLLSDQSEFASFAEGKKLFDQCFKCTEDLLTNLASVGDPWVVIDNAAFGGYGSVDRAASTAAYAGLFSLKSGLGSASDCMVGALIADIGLLDLPPGATLKMRQGNMQAFNPEEKEIYKKHMILSLNQCLSRRVPLSENLKDIILNSHEQADGLGFPSRVKADKIPVESFLIQLSEQFDQQTVVTAGKKRPDLMQIKMSFLNNYIERAGAFPVSFLNSIKPVLMGTS